MLHGHVDEVSHRLIKGWAADDARPHEPLDVSIFVNGLKIAQVACDRLREDLAQTGQFGDGKHGFVFQFASPLPAKEATRLSVRYSHSGAPLTRGECVLSAEGIRVVPPPAPVPPAEPVMMQGPRNPRELFELLYWHDDQLSLLPLLARLDLEGFTPLQVHYATFGVLPDAPIRPPQDQRYYPHDHLNELLFSDAFQTGLLPVLLRAYQDKQRLIFVHIPKCAGTDLSNKLKTRYPWVDVSIMDSEWATKDEVLQHLSHLAVQLRFNDCFYVCGHARLDYYAKHHLVRPNDKVFTIVRNPSDVIISQVNYVLTRFWFDAEQGTVGPDTQQWLAVIGLDGLPDRMTDDFVRDAGMRVLQNTDIVRPNSICFWLGGAGADAQTALDGLISQGVEVTNTTHYTQWLAQRWNIHSQSRDNSSMKFFTVDMLPREYRDYIRDISLEDAKLYQAIERNIARVGRPSVNGQELTRSLE